MAAILYLLGCTLLPGQTMAKPSSPPRVGAGHVWNSSGDLVLMPRLSRGQELIYRGTFREEGRDAGVQFDRAYRLETRLLVLDTPPRGAEVAVLTLLKHRPANGATPSERDSAPVSVRLERAFIDLQGKISGSAHADLLTPLDAAPTLECGGVVALPDGRIRVGQEWNTFEGDRPPLTWRAVGTEMAAGANCFKLVGEQKSEDWDHPRGDRSAWKRQETVWLAPHLGLACRVEREILHREPAQREATRRSRMRMEMESWMQLAGQSGDSRRQEVRQILVFRDNLTPLLDQPARYGPQLAALLRRIDQYVADQPATAYRPALLQVKRRVEAAQRGESPPEPLRDPRPVATGAALGQLAPNFTASNFDGGSTQLRRWMGKPVVLVFYHPSSSWAAPVLRFAQRLQTRHAQRITVAGLSISDNTELIRRQKSDLGLTIPLLSGGGLRTSFGVVSTPKIIVLDGNNIIRGEYLGWAWSGETAREVEEELKRWLPLGSSLPSKPVPAR
jgi:peroxiredoxin